jgi:hypothetical protein
MLTGSLRAYRIANVVGVIFFAAVGTGALYALITGGY